MKSSSRRHGWQRPLHPLQIVGITIYAFLVTSFYCFLGPFVGNRIAQISLITTFSSLALSVMVLFVRCTAIDPSDKTISRTSHPRMPKTKPKSCFKSKLNYGFLLGQIFTRIERKILKTFIRRKYLLDPRITHAPLQPLIPYPLVFIQDTISPQLKVASDTRDEDDHIDFSFCSLCDSQVKKHSKHCRACNRCVEGFDHHCRWLNNCVGKRNYTTFILLMLSVLLMLFIQGGVALAIFIRCFVNKNEIQLELATQLPLKFPRGLLAAVSIFLVLVTAYGSAALGQLFFFHIVLIRKGMRTYDYILAMREQNHWSGLESYDSDFSSDDSSEPDSPETSMSKFLCKGHRTNWSPRPFSAKTDPESGTSILKQDNKGFHASIDPWKLVQMSREKAMMAAAAAKERLAKEMGEQEQLLPLPFEMKSGPLVKQGRDKDTGSTMASLISKERFPTSPGRISSLKRRFSGSPASSSHLGATRNQKYRSSFDLKLTEVSKELETYISRQVLCSVITDRTEASPR